MPRRPRHRTIALVALVLVVLLASPPTGAGAGIQERPPNIVLLIGDDHGWPHSGFMGDPYARTPNLDALAAGGTTFTHAQNPASLCQPTLRTLLAAVHDEAWESKKLALEAVLGPRPRRSEVEHFRTVPKELARRGYRSWEGGKLWEGTFATAGFTHGLATSISPGFFTAVGDRFGREGWSTGTALAPLQEFLDETGDAPFFLWVAPMLPHAPFDAPADLRAPYQQLGLSAAQIGYYANVSWLDAIVGAVVAELTTRGLRDDTLIVYLADNGVEIGNLGGSGRGKGTLYELGARTPVVFNWPGSVPSGVMRDDLVSTLDVPATLLDFAGADTIDDGGARSLREPLVSGSPAGRGTIVSHLRNPVPGNDGHWVRTPSWRYVAASDGREELYAIASDPFEQHDVAAAHPELLAGFRADVLAWQRAIAEGAAVLDATGRVVDPGGAPIAGEAVRLTGRTRTGAKLHLRVLTASDGSYLFDAVPRGTYVLTGARRSGSFHWGRLSGRIPVTLPTGGLGSHLHLRATRPHVPATPGSARIEGTLRAHDGVPVAGALVTVRGGSPRVSVAVLTDATGRYRAEHLTPGTYRVAARSPARRARQAASTTVAPGERSTLDLALRS